MSAPNPDSHAAEWRERSRLLDRFGDPNSARLWALAAAELTEALAYASSATLTIADAAKRTGYTADHLRALIKRGVISNAGRKGAPRIRMADLPPPKRPGGPGRPTRPPLVLRPRTTPTFPNLRRARRDQDRVVERQTDQAPHAPSVDRPRR